MRFLVLLLILFQGNHLWAQESKGGLEKIWEKGLPFITGFTPNQYKADLQNWSVVQDNRGIIYVGNTSGVLEYDGTLWRLIKTPNSTPVRGLARDTKGRIYAGAIGELGYLEPDTLGGMRFHSLLNDLNSEYRDVGDIYFTFASGDSIFFICDNLILRWANNAFKVWKIRSSFAWKVRDEIYVDIGKKGLRKFEGDSLMPVRASADFIGKQLSGLLPYDDTGLLAFGSDDRIFHYDGENLKPFWEKTKFGSMVYSTALLSGGDYAIGTTGTGFFLVDRNGTIKMHLTKRDGLNSDIVLGIYEDAEGDLWLATDAGINRVEISSPLRSFNKRHGLEEGITDVAHFNHTLYAVNHTGAFRLHLNQADTGPFFKKINGIENLTWNCVPLGTDLIIGNFEGIYRIDSNDKVERILACDVPVVEYARDDEGPIFFGTQRDDIGELTHQKDRWYASNERLKINGKPYKILRTTNGNVFINTAYHGIYEISWAEQKKNHTLKDSYNLILYDTSRGLPSNTLNDLSVVQDDVYGSFGKMGLYKYDKSTHTFKSDSSVMVKIPYPEAQISKVEPAYGKGFWLSVYQDYQGHLFKCENDEVTELHLGGRFSDLLISRIVDTDRNIVLIGSDQGIILYHKNIRNSNYNTFNAAIRKVLTNKNTVIYNGSAPEAGAGDIRLRHADNDIRFQISLPSYDLSFKNQYQYFLEGFDETWSTWSGETQMGFTNLKEGSYIFRVRGKDIYGHVSGEGAFAFTILPPWYRTWWAYVIYGLSLIGFIVLIINWRSAELIKEKIQLENTIQERTREISRQAEKLKEMDQIKSSFFANISHEFRTPLTLILAPLEEELKTRSGSGKGLLQLVKRNANRLLELVNQILDLSKLEAGKMTLHVEKADIESFLKVIAASFDSWAQHKQIHFVQHIEIPIRAAWYDKDKVEKIITNLLANAFKFTPANGTVTFAATINRIGDKNILVLTVSDTGKGISPEEQTHVFSSFYQTRQTMDGHEGGTGLGLSLVKELVNIYGGAITLKSTPGIGTVFSIELPTDKEAFSDTLFVEATPSSSSAPVYFSPDYEYTDETVEHEPLLDGKDTILIVEDNVDLQNFMSSILAQQFAVFAASDGEEALEFARNTVPNLVLTDLMMPRMDGIKLTEKLKTDERTSHIPVILLTAKNEQQSRLEGLKTGADDYLTKPFSTEELLVRITNLIRQRKHLAEHFRERILVPITATQELSLDDRFLQKAREVVENNISDPSFTVEKMADEVHLSRTQLLRKIKALTGLSPNDFIKDLRLKKAADMIQQKTDTITQIGYAVGFNDQSYFTKCFKRQFGVTPKEFLKQADQ